MTDEEFLDEVESELRHSFLPPCGGSAVFNDALFDFVLDKAGEDLGYLDREATFIANRLRKRFNVPDFRGKLRVVNSTPAIKFKR